MYRFENLIAWQKAMEFSERIYQVTRTFPKEELYGLTSQLRRASTSIPLNIAEGSGSKTTKEYIQFLYVALRSQYETVTIIKLCQRLGYIDDGLGQQLETLIAEIGRLVQALINSLEERIRSG